MTRAVRRLLCLTAMAAPILTGKATAQGDAVSTLLGDPIVHQSLRSPFQNDKGSEAEAPSVHSFGLRVEPQEPSGDPTLWKHVAVMTGLGAAIGFVVGHVLDQGDCVQIYPPPPECLRHDTWKEGLIWGTGVGATAGGALYLVRRMVE